MERNGIIATTCHEYRATKCQKPSERHKKKTPTTITQQGEKEREAGQVAEMRPDFPDEKVKQESGMRKQTMLLERGARFKIVF